MSKPISYAGMIRFRCEGLSYQRLCAYRPLSLLSEAPLWNDDLTYGRSLLLSSTKLLAATPQYGTHAADRCFIGAPKALFFRR